VNSYFEPIWVSESDTEDDNAPPTFAPPKRKSFQSTPQTTPCKRIKAFVSSMFIASFYTTLLSFVLVDDSATESDSDAPLPVSKKMRTLFRPLFVFRASNAIVFSCSRPGLFNRIRIRIWTGTWQSMYSHILLSATHPHVCASDWNHALASVWDPDKRFLERSCYIVNNALWYPLLSTRIYENTKEMEFDFSGISIKRVSVLPHAHSHFLTYTSKVSEASSVMIWVLARRYK